MKKYLEILVTVFFMTILVACGSDKTTNNNQTKEVVATPDSTTGTQQNEETVTNESIESNNQADTPTGEGLSSYTGAYTDGTNYLVIEGENITLNGHKCEVTKVATDHFKSGVPVYYFMYENNEISIYYDEVCGMGCSLEQPEGSWLTYETIDVAKVPHFDVEDEQVADTTSEASTASQAEKYPFVGVTYKHENLDLTFQLKTPDADGNPTEVLFNGTNYDNVTFNEETFTLSDVTITVTDGSIYTVIAKLPIGEQTYQFIIEGDGDIWRMRGLLAEGDYSPE